MPELSRQEYEEDDPEMNDSDPPQPSYPKGEAVELRAMPADERDMLMRILAHPDVAAHLLRRPDAELTDALLDTLASRLLNTADPSSVNAGIYEPGSSELLGTVSLQSLDRSRGTAYLGYMVHPSRWGQGLATEAVRLMLEYGREELKLTRISGWCRGSNQRSERVMVKNGLSLMSTTPLADSSDDVMKVFTCCYTIEINPL